MFCSECGYKLPSDTMKFCPECGAKIVVTPGIVVPENQTAPTAEPVTPSFAKPQQERKEYNTCHQIKRRGHINITGGEPFFRADIKEILRYLGENKEEFSYGVLSNGSFLNEELVAVLKETEVSFVQLSIDGDRAMHDSLRVGT